MTSPPKPNKISRRLLKMTTKLLLYAALLTAGRGLALAAFRILRTNRAIATVWPDWEGIKSTTPLWITLALALSLSAATAFIPEKPAKTSKIPQPVPQAENLKLEKEIAKLLNQIKELKQKESTQTQPTPTSPTNNPTKNTPEKPRQTVTQALITGSTKSLLNLLANQLTVNPFHYSNLQSSLKHRLRNGYNPAYLATLNAANGTTHLWKIKTTAPGPDILQKLTISNGKITAFHFDNLR